VKSEIHRLLHNPISMGEFDWKGRRYQGTHDPLISRKLWERTQEAFADANRPRYIKHRFAYTGLLTCGACGCAITAERRKGRYVYYHCRGYRGPCKSGYVREEVPTTLFADVVGRIQLTAEQAEWITTALRESQADKEREHHRALLVQQQQFQRVQQMLDRAYEDRLAGTISEDLWLRRSREWELELSRLRTDLERRETAGARYMLLGSQILELARGAKSLFLRQDPAEQRRLLKTLLSNCSLKAGSLCPAYRKPFDALVCGNETGNWLGGRDSNPDNVVRRPHLHDHSVRKNAISAFLSSANIVSPNSCPLTARLLYGPLNPVETKLSSSRRGSNHSSSVPITPLWVRTGRSHTSFSDGTL
jgi:hypothetical protein